MLKHSHITYMYDDVTTFFHHKYLLTTLCGDGLFCIFKVFILVVELLAELSGLQLTQVCLDCDHEGSFCW